MSKRLYLFCEKYNILDENQNGFRKGKSTTLAVFNYINEVMNIVNNKEYAIGLLIDMSKAYDRVNFDILLHKLYGIGVRGIAHKWFSSYLSNRVQYVDIEHLDYSTGKINRARSKRIQVTQSIPQGSVMGCLLFLIYINDLPKVIDCHCTIFADDISIVFPCNNASNLKTLLNNTISTIVSWLEQHSLNINFNKTKMMQFKPYQKRPLTLDYAFHKQKLQCVDSHLLLGIYLDTNLNWKEHVSMVSSKLSRFAYALYELKRTTDTKTALNAYYAYAHSRLLYGILLWGNSTDTDQLFRIQKKCIRTIANIKSTESCRSYFVKYKILTLTAIYILECCNFVKKHINKFPNYSRPKNLRPRERLAMPTSKLQLFKSGPYAMCIKIFNKIPRDIKSEENPRKLKKKLRLLLITKCYYSLDEFLNDNSC